MIWKKCQIELFTRSLKIYNVTRLNGMCGFTSSDESTACGTPTKTKKVTVVKRWFPPERDTSKVIEYKDASEAIKKLNWENKNLYGPLQTSKVDYKKKINEANQIIQHQTQIPIVEPTTAPQTEPISTSQTAEEDAIMHSFVFNNITDFPLMNKSNCSEKEWKQKIDELNLLRKYLENFSATYIPSVSVILEKTMSADRAENLRRWKQNLIKQLGEEGFQKYHAELLARGASFHSTINSFLTSTPEKELYIEEGNRGHWKSLKAVIPHINDIKLLEERISHPFLCYKGVLDCFAKYRNHLVVIDWKTSKKTKPSLSSTFDNPLQIAAYVGALNFDPKFQYLANKGVIIVAYENGGPANVLFIDETKMLRYWKEWLERVKKYWEMVKTEEDKKS